MDTSHASAIAVDGDFATRNITELHVRDLFATLSRRETHRDFRVIGKHPEQENVCCVLEGEDVFVSAVAKDLLRHSKQFSHCGFVVLHLASAQRTRGSAAWPARGMVTPATSAERATSA